VLIWPTVAYGHYPAFSEFPGSCSLERDTFAACVASILRDIRRTGVRILIVNTGISTIEPLQSAVHACALGTHVRLANVYCGPRYLQCAEALATQEHGGHADELETSIMLAIDPGRVALEQARPWDRQTARSGPFQRSREDAPNYTPQGIWGDPTRASVEKGQALLQAMLDDLDADLTALLA